MNSGEVVTFSMIVAQILNGQIAQMGKTQKEFFATSGISQATWSRIMRGLSHFSVEDMRSAARAVERDLPEVIEEAEKVANELPAMDVAVAEKDGGSKGPSIIGPVLAGAALGFLISRILSNK